ncbi:MAG: hypothetical protein V7629_13305 [Motiliproteus sp.]
MHISTTLTLDSGHRTWAQAIVTGNPRVDNVLRGRGDTDKKRKAAKQKSRANQKGHAEN